MFSSRGRPRKERTGNSTAIKKLRASDRDRKARVRAAESTLTIPQCQDSQRRERLEADDVEWLMHYFGEGSGCEDPFTYRFVPQQVDMIRAIANAIKNGGDQAIAASRGEGKTLIAERLVTKYVLQGLCRYAVIFAATGPMADAILRSIASYIESNNRLYADYPEACYPVRCLEGASQRARTQRATGTRHDNGEPYEAERLRYSWCGGELIFPQTPGSPSANAIIATRGLDAAVRGLRSGKRPELAVIDDPDTEQTANSEEQAAKLLKRIDAAIAGLGGQKRKIGRVALTTIQTRTSVAYTLTDPSKRPSFKGRRYRWLVKQPDRVEMWDEYIQMRAEDQQAKDDAGNHTDPDARRAYRFYRDHREQMDAGAMVANPNRYNSDLHADGEPWQLSALQAYYDLVATMGADNVATEYDNEPPAEAAIVESGISPQRIQRKCSGYERRCVPPGCTVVTCGIDVRKVALHWVVRAWAPDCSGYTIDYGVHEIYGTRYGSDEGLDEAIRRAILDFYETSKSVGYHNTDGEIVPIDLTLIDSGWRMDAVYAACLEIGTGIMPVKGFGRSGGCAGASFVAVQRATTDRRPGDGWFLSRQGKLWLVCADADRWKAWEHDRWMTPADAAGSMQIFGSPSKEGQRLTADEKTHFAYAKHICNESEQEYTDRRGNLRRGWKTKNENTHWLDASYYSSIAANVRGIRMATSAAVIAEASKPSNVARPTLSQLAKRR